MKFGNSEILALSLWMEVGFRYYGNTMHPSTSKLSYDHSQPQGFNVDFQLHSSNSQASALSSSSSPSSPVDADL